MSFYKYLSVLRLCTLAAFFCLAVTLGTTTQAQTSETPQALPSADEVSVKLDDLVTLLVPLTGADLAEMAVVWQGHLKAALTEVSLLDLSMKSSDGAEAEKISGQIDKRKEIIKKIQGNYVAVLDAWVAKGAAPEDVKQHRAYILSWRAAAVKSLDPRTMARYAKEWAISWDGGLGVIIKAVMMIIAIWVLMFVARFLKRASKRGLDRVPNMSRLLQTFVVNSVYWMTFIFGIVTLLGIFGVNVSPLFAVFGGLSFILGFALQDTLGNLASGLMIMILKPFDTGDFIQVGGTSGVVDEMSIVSTQMRTFDNQIIVIPNSKIWGDVITNVNASAERRVDLVFGIGYSDKADHAIDVLKELVNAHPMCLENPGPEVFVGELGDSSVNIFCRPWSKTEDYWRVYWDLTAQAKERFDEEGISFPFPQRDVHLIQQT